MTSPGLEWTRAVTEADAPTARISTVLQLWSQIVAADCPEETPKPSLILVDDHRMLLEMLASTLAGDYCIEGVASTAAELLALLETRAADGILLDLQLPDRSDLSLVEEVHRRWPAMRILVLTMFCDRAVAEAAFAAGADGYLVKDSGTAELRRAVADVLAGRRYTSPLLPKSSRRTGLEALHPAIARLTLRQQEVLCLLGGGKRETEVAGQLGLSPSAVTFHKKNIQRVLGLESDRALLGYAVLLHGCLADRNQTTTDTRTVSEGHSGPPSAEPVEARGD